MIESKEFYKLFSKVKRTLDQQATSHHTAGILVNPEDVDGQVEGAIDATARLCGSLTRDAPNRQTIGEPCRVRSPGSKKLSVPHVPISENMAMHRANSLLAILPNALATEFSEIDPEPVPLKVSS